jgi:hypothetical protein
VKHKFKVLAASTALAIGLSLLNATPAEACEQPHPTPSPTTEASVSTTDTVRVTQRSPGSAIALLEWPAVTGATGYRIFKTGSIRPRWRLFALIPSGATSRTVADKPGAIAIYRVVAVVGSREVDLGSFTYIPVKQQSRSELD